MPIKADRPTTTTGTYYHTHTGAGDLASLCLIPGAPGRVHEIAEWLTDVKMYLNEDRGIVSCTGKYQGVEVSAATSGMGVPSAGIIFPEAVASGARIIIRVGSCGSLLKESKLGDVIVVTGGVRYDGTATDWTPIEFPAIPDYRVTAALIHAAQRHAPGNVQVGLEATTSTFYAGQGRPSLLTGEIPEPMAARHREMLRLGVGCYSMEAAGLFVWGLTEGKGVPTGAINTVYALRHPESSQEFGKADDERAITIGLETLRNLAADDSLADYISRRLPVYPALA
jgi:uridine phosphorylase